jgi:hypothetical protein
VGSLLWNTRVDYRVDKSQINPVDTLPILFLTNAIDIRGVMSQCFLEPQVATYCCVSLSEALCLGFRNKLAHLVKNNSVLTFEGFWVRIPAKTLAGLG